MSDLSNLPELFNNKGRVYWQEDEKYLEFQKNILFESYFSFDEIFNFCPLTKLLEISEIQKEKIKKEWLRLSQFWNKNSTPPCQYGMAFLLAILPYDEITNVEIISTFEMQVINIVHHYNFDKDLNYEGAIPIYKRGPIFPPAFIEWMEDENSGYQREYGAGIWWIGYCMYERINGLYPIKDFIPTKKIEI
jgi:hypothetical protein